ncbi:hypothetical protein Ngar_c35790 [Candidatus Nitrososphaera gargensis Ga9.2]|uniref:Uncharacterized protein n=1 Tax=Nitrososphaera gargensis (strain Ga9.2) TaxID=1237085 RepID=K0IMQ7_NITGG|nr:hypothetical protein [Candidatus Nitrososphaera gargensis]AFU60492.1 hypothetical protein Ngar_c35790 [Candidatus Nitrososphaera gargensis Ga9.2]
MGNQDKAGTKSFDDADTFCRACETELKAMAVCIKCGNAMLYGCPRCALFSETKVHIDCLYQLCW